MSRFDPTRHRRRSVRLPGHGYAGGVYFVTVCSHGRECLFGEVVEKAVVLSEAGVLVWEAWEALPDLFPLVHLDTFVVMPSHVHGIIEIWQDANLNRRGVINHAPTPARRACGHGDGLMADPRTTLGKVVRACKARAIRPVNETRGTLGAKVWQRSHWERVLRNERELRLAREYVLQNPLRWHLDRYGPNGLG